MIVCLMLQLSISILFATTARPVIVLRTVRLAVVSRFHELNDTDYGQIKRSVQLIQQAVSSGRRHL